MGIAIALASIFILVILHELGHFLFAKKFGIKVEEFGIGIPPRVAGKKWGETLYSLNLLPLGAFVKMKGEQSSDTSPRSFGSKPVWQRIIIVLGGVASSWLVAIILFTILVGTAGIPTVISDEDVENIRRSQIFIAQVAPNSPAEKAGLLVGDVVQGFDTMTQLQEFVEEHKGEEIQFLIQRLGESELVPVFVTPRIDVPKDEGATGIVLQRVGFVTSPWYKAPIQGTIITGRVTFQIFAGFGRMISGQEQVSVDQFRGPIGIIDVLQSSLSFGFSGFLQLIGMIAIFLAIFNTLPIPALDGGRFVFLAIEGIIRKPLPDKLMQILIISSFVAFIPLIIWVSINDIQRLF